VDEMQSAFLLDGSTTTMELSIAICVLTLAVCFVCFAIFCLFYARFKLKYGNPAQRGTATEMESVMSSVDFKYDDKAARPGSTTQPQHTMAAQWEIDVPDDAETEDPEAETGSLPPPRASPRRRRTQRRRRAAKGKGKGATSRRAKYEKVVVDAVDCEAVAAKPERNAFDLRGVNMESLRITDVPSSKPTVSPPSTVSMLREKISVQDVQPAFYVPGMNMLASPPLPPQPDHGRFSAVPKPEDIDGDHSEDPDDQLPAFMASPTVTALSEVTASTKLNGLRGWNGNDDDEQTTLVAHSVDGDAE